MSCPNPPAWTHHSAPQVYIVTSSQTYNDYLEWATNKELSLGFGFPPANIINVGEQGLDDLQALAYAVGSVPGLGDGYAVVAR